MADEEKHRVLIIDANDWNTVLGMGWIANLSEWETRVVHASDPTLPLNSRTSRFLQIVGVVKVPIIDRCAVIEVIESTHISRAAVPPMWCRGHRINLTFHPGTQGRVEIPSVWEISVDDQTIGALPADITDVKELAKKALEFGESYIEERMLEIKSRFS